MAKIASKKITSEGVTFTFGDGKVLAVKRADMPEAIVEKLVLHGIAAKVGDAYAGDKTPTDARKSAEKAYANLLKGVWADRDSGIIVEAIARIKKISIDAAQAAWDDADDDAKAATKAHEGVKKVMAIIRGERAQSKADSNDELPI